jgi:spore cortex biosynthesis protein YabQ
VSLNVQFLTLWMMFVSGMGLGFLFDIYRVISSQLHFPRWVISILDIIYWIIATLFAFKMLYSSNQGEVRVFVFIGLLIGLGVYTLLFSSFIKKCILLVIRITRGIIRFGLRVFYILVIVPVVAIYKVFMIFLGFLAAISVFIYKFVLQLFYPFWKLLLRLIRWIAGRILPNWFIKAGNKLKIWFRKLF